MLARLHNLRLPRRRREALLLSLIACASVASLRSTGQPPWMLGIEGVLIATAAIGLLLCNSHTSTVGSTPGGSNRAAPVGLWNSARWQCVGAMVLMTLPLLCRIASRWLGISEPWEMVALSTLAEGSVALALIPASAGTASLSVVCSGFLTLFATTLSDRAEGIWLAALWALVCLWWLVANHWERLEVCLVHSVRRETRLRVVTTSMLGVALIAGAGLAVWGRGPSVGDLGWGVMPTSGGHDWNDPAARSGVGDGDAVVAARERAASFGSVESELFLDSDQPSLFDVFSEVLGEPTRTKDQQRAVALSPSDVEEMEQHAAESQHAEQTFTTVRQSPPPVRGLENRSSTAVLHWIGTPGERLALERFDTFDGFSWTQTNDSSEVPLKAVHMQDRVWFFRTSSSDDSVGSDVTGQAVKFINLHSPRIPAPAFAAGVHIANIDQADFFAIGPDGSWVMPEHDAVPVLTVVRLVSRQIHADVLESAERFPRATVTGESSTAGVRKAAEMAASWTASSAGPWGQVRAIVARLRGEFTFDRSSTATADDPLADFFATRRGGDHLFATAAAVMLRSLGYRTRLVVGFYADPDDYSASQRHTVIGPEDAHVWVEVAIKPQVWLPIEPTPGYAPPRLYRSLASRIRAAAWASAPWATGCLLLSLLAWRWRADWCNFLSAIAWTVSRPLDHRRRLRILMWILDVRCRFARHPRPAGVPQRRWFGAFASQLDTPLKQAAERCFDVADALTFCPTEMVTHSWLVDADSLARCLTVQRIAASEPSESRNPQWV